MKDEEKHSGNRREFLRVRVSIPVQVMCPTKKLGGAVGEWLPARMMEIGGGGVRISACSNLEAGDVLAVRFALPDKDADMKLYGRIVAVCGVGRGLCVKFVGISEKQRKAILQYAFREQIRIAKKVEAESGAAQVGGSEGEIDN
jgi:c-di-GMP-binding flagellar brake protein YcgR